MLHSAIFDALILCTLHFVWGLWDTLYGRLWHSSCHRFGRFPGSLYLRLSHSALETLTFCIGNSGILNSVFYNGDSCTLHSALETVALCIGGSGILDFALCILQWRLSHSELCTRDPGTLHSALETLALSAFCSGDSGTMHPALCT